MQTVSSVVFGLPDFARGVVSTNKYLPAVGSGLRLDTEFREPDACGVCGLPMRAVKSLRPVVTRVLYHSGGCRRRRHNRRAA